jgi:VIT1/CCC1 family predicted Fe2+/Mn2+ transporter
MSDQGDNPTRTPVEHEKTDTPVDNDTTTDESREPTSSSPTAIVEVKSYDKARDAFKRGDVEASRAEHAKKSTAEHKEKHGGAGGDYVKAVTFGGLDGIITTFAIIAAAAGANEDWKTVLVFGFANVLADAFSMGFGEFIGGSAERDFALRERAREEWEVENCIDVEIQEMVELYEAKGISTEDAVTMVSIISKDPKIFVDFMMIEELELLVDLEDKWGSLKQAIVMFISFVCFGVIPVLAYVGGVGQGADYVFGISVGLTGIALIGLGALKGYLTSMNMIISALLMLFNGSISGGVSYGVGALLEYIVNV